MVVRRLLALFCASIALCEPLFAQTPLPVFDPYHVQSLSFRPGSRDDVLMGVRDQEYRLQAHLARVSQDGKHLLTRTLPGFHVAMAWLDGNNLVTADEKGTLWRWPVGGGEPMQLVALNEPVAGIGVSPRTRVLAVRLTQGPIRFFYGDGRPAGPSIALGRPSTTGEDCPPSGIETTTGFSADERLMVYAGLCGELRVGARDGGRLIRTDVQRPYLKRHVFSSDGKVLLASYTGQPGGGADLWPVAVGRLGTPKPLPGPIEHNDPADIAALPDGAGFLVLSTDRLRVINLEGRPTRLDVAIAKPTRLALSPEGTRVAVAAEEGLVLFDRSGRRVLDRPFAEFGAPFLTVPLANNEFGAISREGVMRFFRPDGTQGREPIELWDHTSLEQDAWLLRSQMFVSPNGRVFGLHAPNGRFELFDASWQRIGRPFMFPMNDTRLATVLLDDRILRPMPDSQGFVVFAFDGRVLGRLPLSGMEKGGLRMAASANGVVVTHSWKGGVQIWNSAGQVVRQRAIDPASGRFGNYMRVAPDGRSVVIYDSPGYEGKITVWRPESEQLQSFDGAFVRLMADGALVRFAKGKLFMGQRSIDVDAGMVHAMNDDGTLAMVTKKGVARTVQLKP
jgi:WD40 repeat protein